MGFPRTVKLSECSQKELERLLMRSQVDVDCVLPNVTKIVSDVRRSGDRALLKYTERFDGVKLSIDKLRVDEREFRVARTQLAPETTHAGRRAVRSIRKFHLAQMPREWTAQLC